MNVQSITNRATATSSFGATVVISNQAQATIKHRPQTSKIMPKSVTCSQCARGGAADLFDTYYKVMSGKISNMSPNGLLYLSKVTVLEKAGGLGLRLTQFAVGLIMIVQQRICLSPSIWSSAPRESAPIVRNQDAAPTRPLHLSS